MRLTIAARQSHLARHQALEVAEALKKKHPHLDIQFHFRESLGDKHLTDPLWKMPERGVFTEDFVDGLKQGEFDLVVHSWKDLPVESRDGLDLIACLPRADQRDLLLVKKQSLKKNFSKQKLTIYSSSPRRIYNLGQLLPQLWPQPVTELEFQSVRGNIPTRIRKMLEAQDVDGLILAKAALDRLMMPREGQEWVDLRTQLRQYLNECEWMVLPLSENPTAAAQGAIVVEARSDRQDLRELFVGVHCSTTFGAVQKERQTLKAFGGGCHLALGISVTTKNHQNFLCVKGQTPEGNPLNELHSEYEGPKFASSEVTVVENRGVKRKPMEVNLAYLEAAKGLFITRAEAWPEGYKGGVGQILWTAGLQTWKKLASQGVWINGTTDSLGFDYPELDFLEMRLNENNFLRLTHREAAKQSGEIAVYEITQDFEIDLPRQCEMFFWKSGILAEKLFQKHPWLMEKKHATGFGDTSTALQKLLSDKKQNLWLFINSEEFKKIVTIA